MLLSSRLAVVCFLVVAIVFKVRGDATEHRLDCLLTEKEISQQKCHQRGCLWIQTSDPKAPRIPACFLDTAKVGYTVLKESVHKKPTGDLEATLQVKPQAHHSFPFAPVEKVKLEVTHLSDNILRIRLTNPAQKRYEVPLGEALTLPKTSGSANSAKYEVSLNADASSFDLVVSRKGSSVKMIDTSLGGLIYSEHFLQFVTHVASTDVYGMGENYETSFKHDFNYKTHPLFSNGRAPTRDRDLYGVHPFYTVVEADGKAHGVFLLNSNAMAFTTMPTPALSIKAMGGILDFFVFVGDNPEHVVQLYTSVIGRPVMPPFWGLGFQLSRYGYKNLTHMQKVINRNINNHVPIDVNYLDIDYMDEYRDFTYDKNRFKGLPEYMKETKAKNGFYWVVITDPVIQGDKPGYHPFDEGYKRDVFVKWPSSIPMSQRTKPGNAPTDKGVMYGKMWPPGPAAFVDFFRNASRQYWIDMHKEFHKELPFDAIWIDMNEPANFGSQYLHCPKMHDHINLILPSQNYAEGLESGTMCMSAVQGDHGQYSHYDVHSLYGWSETKPTYEAVQQATGKRGFVVTRSTYASSGRYAAHWLGDNFATWEQLRASIVGMLEFSLFGIAYTGADICGHNMNAPPELCRRWLQLGAYYPYSRSHNTLHATDQDPGYWAEVGFPEVTQSAVQALRVRYQLLHYLYTVFYHAHTTGTTVVRPMHHEFPHDDRSRVVDHQFLLGSSLLVCPFLYEHQTSVKADIPWGSGWYRMEGDFVNGKPETFVAVFPEEESYRPLLLREGSILPIVGEAQLPKSLNTVNLRKAPIELWVLPNTMVGDAQASGDLFWDDGDSIDTIEKGVYNFYKFGFEKCKLTISLAHGGFKESESSEVLKLSTIHIAIPFSRGDVDKVTIDGHAAKFTASNHTVKIEANNLDLLKLSKPVMVQIANSKVGCIFSH